MFLITIALGQTAVPLLYKTDETAKSAWELLTTPSPFPPVGVATSMERLRGVPAPVYLTDDFGRTVTIMPNALSGAIFEDMDQTKLSQVEIALHHARTQAAANKRGSTDPELRSMAQGPAMLHPMMGMPGNGRLT